MSICEATSSVGAVSYTSIAWESFKSIEGHPLDFLLNQGIPVYYKIHRGLFFSYTHRWVPLARPRPGIVPALSANETDYSTILRDEQLLLLRLDDEDLCEILQTGSRVVTEFSLGGLGLPKPEAGDSGRIEVDLVGVDFHRCHLVNRQRWKQVHQAASFGSPPRPEDYAEPMWIGYEDLYLESNDLAALKNLRMGVGVEREPYPFATDERKLPAPLNWLYQAAFARNRDGEALPKLAPSNKPDRKEEMKAIESWLRLNSPGKIFDSRCMRTAITLVPLDYKFKAPFDERWLTEFRMGEALRNPHLSVALTLALAITEWWLDAEKTDLKAKRIELAGLLEDVGFQKIAVYDLTGIISGEAVSDEHQKGFDELLDDWQKEKGRASPKRLGAHDILLTHGEALTTAERTSSGADVLTNGDSKTGSLRCWAPRI